MNSDDLYKVWEIKTKKSLPREEEARKFLEEIAEAVQPIMLKHEWSVKLLSESSNKGYLGWNAGAGAHVTLRLRRLNWYYEWDHWNFLSFDEVLDTMLHELCHNVYLPHNDAFYKLWDELRKEYAELRPKGIPSFVTMEALGPQQAGREITGVPLNVMNSDDLYKVWEIKTKKSLPREEEARKFLEEIAEAVQPIMLKHKLSVKLLSEFCNKEYLGWNAGTGAHVKLRLRRLNCDYEWDHWNFLSFDEVLDTMLYQLCRNVHPPYNAAFNKLWDELRKEYADLRPKGIPGFGNWFSPQPPLSAAEKWSQIVGSLLPSRPRPKRLSGDIVTMEALSPAQAAAIPAERRLQDNIWCGCEHSDDDFNYESAENIVHKRESPMCTLLNKSCASLCEFCDTQQPKDVATKYNTWSCKSCTLENSVKMEKCSACDHLVNG